MNKEYIKYLLSEVSKQVSFDEESHTYHYGNKKLISTTQFLGQFKPEFESVKIATKSSSIKTSKYYNIPVNDILQEWEDVKEIACMKGTLIHKAAEFISLGLDDKIKVPEEFNSYIEQLIQFFTEINPDIIAPEVILFNSELLLGGMIDLITFNKDGTIDIYDWKTNKELKKSNRYTKTYSTPINHILDTSIEGYSLQLTVYKKMLEYHKFKVRDMFIVHITPDNYTVIKCKDYSTEINELFEVRKKQIS